MKKCVTIHIDYLLAEPYMKNLGENAKKWGIDHWSLDKGVQNVLGVYESAITKRKNK